MSRDVLEKPILVIGAARSGTQLLAQLLARHPDVVYIDEPRYVWSRGLGHLPHEMIPASYATPARARAIRERFRAMCEARGGSRICEKTPANSLRLPFVMRVFPDARILHMIRDGREVTASARKKFHGHVGKVTRSRAPDPGTKAPAAPAPRLSAFRRALRLAANRFRMDSFPLRDFPFHARDLADQLLAQMGLKSRSVWGPRIPAMRALLRTHTTAEVAALQWRACVEHTRNYLASAPQVEHLDVRFEELCSTPREVAGKVFAFCELSPPDDLDRTLASILPYRAGDFRSELSEEELRLVEGHLASTLRELGYER